jgi:very-short-patch-repair endonuclease
MSFIYSKFHPNPPLKFKGGSQALQNRVNCMTHIHGWQQYKHRRQELRKDQTEVEVLLWSHLRKKQMGVVFHRQHSIGPYIVDFYCPKAHLIIELDGEQHKDNKEYDKERDDFLRNINNTVLRFWNNEISSNLDEVLLTIRKTLATSPLL